MNKTIVKQILLNTALGHFALMLRAKIEIVQAALLHPEAVGFVANDQIGGLLVARLVEPSKVFVDVGAHIGSVTAEVLYHNKTVDVIAIEAIPEKAQRLRKKFTQIKVQECAVGDSEQKVSFFINKLASGYSSLTRPKGENNRTVEINVAMKTLDQLLPHSGVDVIKFDIEGGELRAIQGGKKVIQSNRPTLYFESGADMETFALESIWQELQLLNYKVILPNRMAHNDEEGLSLQGFLESHMYPRRTTNYFAVPTERRMEIRNRARNVLRIRSDIKYSSNSKT